MISSFFSAFDQFRTMTPIDVVDILVVAYIIYRVMKLLKDTSAARLAKGILILVLIMLFASFLRLTMISWLLRNALSGRARAHRARNHLSAGAAPPARADR